MVTRALARVVGEVRRGHDTVPSPNIWHWPEVYEVENRAQDVEGDIWRVLAELVDWTGRDVADVGCGDGFHLPRFAETARRVVGIEPHLPLVRRARDRVAGQPVVEVLAGSAQRLPLPDASVDLVHARTAYFFGPGCEPGLAEADRVLRPGGSLVIVDLDVRHRPYGDWMHSDLPGYDTVEVDEFFARNGFTSRQVETLWRFDTRADLDAVLRIEFSARVAARAVAEVVGQSLPVGYRVMHRHKPTGLLRP
ncbi:MAG: class I SAM-dependent methyltransferase [Actinophytocola sp.]|uniref:class I SAM-dependent methyltransferase n=1 Tax=Actinophytocola sp. TaxID=1872138 RepID=UPI003D6A393B